VDVTEAESAIMDAVEAQAAADAEAARQAAKPEALKTAENNFFGLCHAIFGDYQKRGFAELQAALDAILTTDPNTATVLSIKLLAIDAECKREGGLLWFDDAAIHPELMQ
jgi:hypothetical protein